METERERERGLNIYIYIKNLSGNAQTIAKEREKLMLYRKEKEIITSVLLTCGEGRR